MSFGLSRTRPLDPLGVAVSDADLPPLPDDALSRPESAIVDPRNWFPRPHLPFEIEIGSGKGTFLVSQALRQPDTNHLGIEWTREFFLYAADRVRRRRLNNVRVLHADAVPFIHWRVPDAIVSVIHLYFPDPWPKARHHRRRTIQHDFLRDAHRVLVPSGELRVVTDHADYWAWMQQHFAEWTGPDAPFLSLPFNHADADTGELVGSNFERKYRREGRPFHAVILRKRA